MATSGFRGVRAVRNRWSLRCLRAPALVLTLIMALLYWVRGVPTWGAQLGSLGLTPEDCDLVEDVEGLLGDPKANRWDIKKEWLVAVLRDSGEWVILPSIEGAAVHECCVDAFARKAFFGMAMGGTGSPSHRDPLKEHPPWISPRPSLGGINYVRWSAVETDPAKCPRCGEYMRCKWKYCPDCGIELKKEGLAEPNSRDSTVG